MSSPVPPKKSTHASSSWLEWRGHSVILFRVSLTQGETERMGEVEPPSGRGFLSLPHSLSLSFSTFSPLMLPWVAIEKRGFSFSLSVSFTQNTFGLKIKKPLKRYFFLIWNKEIGYLIHKNKSSLFLSVNFGPVLLFLKREKQLWTL